jgi:anti-sigma factor RsiW
MSRLSSEILNKYIDGDLDEDTRKKVSNQLEFSEEDRKIYMELYSVHQGLKRLKPEAVRADFTSVFMSQLLKRKKSFREQKIFIYSVGSIFVVAAIIIVGIIISVIFSNSGTNKEDMHAIADAMIFAGKTAKDIGRSFSGINIPVLGSILSIFMFLSAYYFFNSMKLSRERLKHFN